MKKGNRFLIIIGILAAMIAGWYMLIDNQRQVNQEYQNALNEGRRLANLKIYSDAQTYYLQAYEIQPDYDLGIEIASFYKNMGDNREFESFTEDLISENPYNASGYEILLTYFYEAQDFKSCVDVIQKAQKRKVSSEKITQIEKQIKKEYEIQYARYMDVAKFSNGYCAVQGENGLWGYVGESGVGSISCEYQAVTGFSLEEQLAAVRNEEGECFLVDAGNNRKEADEQQRVIGDCKMLSEGYMAIQVNGKYSFVQKNYSGAFGEYEDAGSFSEGIAPVKEGGKWYLIHPDGSKATESGFDEIVMDELGVCFRQERAFVKNAGKYIMIDASGKQMGDSTYESVVPFNESGWAAVKKNGKWGFVDASGKETIEPVYEEARSFSNGCAAVKENGKWGLIYEDRSYLLECQFDGAKDLTANKSCFVKSGEEWNLLIFYL